MLKTPAATRDAALQQLVGGVGRLACMLGRTNDILAENYLEKPIPLHYDLESCGE